MRRGLVPQAQRLAHALLAEAPADALRRACVICLEDAALHPQLPAVVWLMVAHGKGLQLSVDHQALLLSFSGDLARCAVHDTGVGPDGGAPRSPLLSL